MASPLDITIDTTAIAAPQWTPTAALVIDSPEHYGEIAERLKTNKTFQKHVIDFFRPLKEKAKAAHQALCDAERQHLEPAQQDEARDKKALAAYDAEQDRLRLIEQARLEAEAREREEARRLAEAAELEAQALAADDSEMLVEANDLIAQRVETPTVIVPRTTPIVKGISMRETWRFEVVNAALVPREYLAVDLTKIGGVVRALKGSTKIAGVKVWAEKSVAAGGR